MSLSACAVHHFCKEYGKWSRKSSSLLLINPCPVSSLDTMLEIWTGLQLLTTSLAPIQEQRSTSFFTSYQEKEIVNALPDGKSCLWMRTPRWCGFCFCSPGARRQRFTVKLPMISHTQGKFQRGDRCNKHHTSNWTSIILQSGCLPLLLLSAVELVLLQQLPPTLISLWPTRTQGSRVKTAWAASLSLQQQHSETSGQTPGWKEDTQTFM